MKKILQFSLTIATILALVISCAKEEPEVKKFNLTVSASEGGSVSTQGGVYVEGEIARVTATPSDGYVFSGWSNGSSDNPIQITMNSNTSITANFTKVKYAIDITVDGQGSVTEEVVSSGKEYDSGSVVKLTAVPSEGWLFSHWSGASNVIENTVELTADSNKSITAHFIEIPFEAISVGDGTIATELVYNDSNEVTAFKLTATTPVGWRFDGWTGGVQSSEMIIEVATDLAENVTATFIQVYDLTLNIVGEGEVTDEIITDTSKTFDAGTNVKLTAVPASGWRFDKWTGSVESNEAVIVVNVDDAKEITATFIQVYDLTVTIEGEGTVTEEIVTTTDKTTSYDTGVTVKLTAEPAERWRFDKWTGAIESTETVVQVEMSEAKEVTATFVKIYDLTVTVEGEGTVTEEIVTTTDKTTSYDTGVTVKLTAEPAEGWRFDKWTGAIESTETVIQVDMNEAREVTATFIKIYDLNVIVVGEGEVTEEIVVDETGKTYDTGTTIKLTATPAEGWRFVGWSGAKTSTDSSTTVLVDDAKEITATFIQVYDLTVTVEGEGTVTEEIVTTTDKTTSYDTGVTVKLTAEPAEGWRFDKWTGDITSTENPVQITIDGPKTVKVKFEEVYYKLNYLKINNLQDNIGSVHSILYQTDVGEYLIDGIVNWADPNLGRKPLVRMKRNDESWEVVNIYSDVDMSEIRQHEILPNGEGVLIGDHGPEWDNLPREQWPYSHVYLGKFQGEEITWQKVSPNAAFYHDVSYGDFNYDGINDITAVHMGARDDNTDDPQIFVGNSSNGFDYKFNAFWGLPGQEGGCCGDVEIFDFDGDGKEEIVAIGGGADLDFDSIRIYKYNQNDDNFEIIKDLTPTIPSLGSVSYYEYTNDIIISNNWRGYSPTNKRFFDFNNDGNFDFVNEKNGLTVWYGDGNMNFTGERINKQSNFNNGVVGDYYQMSGQDILDIEGDGDADIITRISNFGSTINTEGIDLSKLVYINDNGKFKRLSGKNYTVSYNELKKNFPYYLIPTIRNNKLVFIGPILTNPSQNPELLMLEIETNINANYWYDSFQN